MKITITNKQIAWVAMLLIGGITLFLPFLGVVKGKQPIFYKSEPAASFNNTNVIGLNGKVVSSEYRYSAEYVDWLYNYKWNKATEGQKFMSVVRGIEMVVVSIVFIVLIFIYGVDAVQQNYSRVVVEIEPFKAQRIKREEADKLLKLGAALEKENKPTTLTPPVEEQRADGSYKRWT